MEDYLIVLDSKEDFATSKFRIDYPRSNIIRLHFEDVYYKEISEENFIDDFSQYILKNIPQDRPTSVLSFKDTYLKATLEASKKSPDYVTFNLEEPGRELLLKSSCDKGLAYQSYDSSLVDIKYPKSFVFDSFDELSKERSKYLASKPNVFSELNNESRLAYKLRGGAGKIGFADLNLSFLLKYIRDANHGRSKYRNVEDYFIQEFITECKHMSADVIYEKDESTGNTEVIFALTREALIQKGGCQTSSIRDPTDESGKVVTESMMRAADIKPNKYLFVNYDYLITPNHEILLLEHAVRFGGGTSSEMIKAYLDLNKGVDTSVVKNELAQLTPQISVLDSNTKNDDVINFKDRKQINQALKYVNSNPIQEEDLIFDVSLNDEPYVFKNGLLIPKGFENKEKPVALRIFGKKLSSDTSRWSTRGTLYSSGGFCMERNFPNWVIDEFPEDIALAESNFRKLNKDD